MICQQIAMICQQKLCGETNIVSTIGKTILKEYKNNIKRIIKQLIFFIKRT